MNIESIGSLAKSVGVSPETMVLAIVWTFLWKGLALWRAANLQQKYWFVAILFINTMGVLEIIYLFFISKNYKIEVVEERK